MITFLTTIVAGLVAAHVFAWLRGYRLFPKKYVEELIDEKWALEMEKRSWGTGDEELQESYEMQILSLNEKIDELKEELSTFEISWNDKDAQVIGLEEQIADLKEEVESYQKTVAGYQEEIFQHRENCLPQAPRKLKMGE